MGSEFPCRIEDFNGFEALRDVLVLSSSLPKFSIFVWKRKKKKQQ